MNEGSRGTGEGLLPIATVSCGPISHLLHRALDRPPCLTSHQKSLSHRAPLLSAPSALAVSVYSRPVARMLLRHLPAARTWSRDLVSPSVLTNLTIASRALVLLACDASGALFDDRVELSRTLCLGGRIQLRERVVLAALPHEGLASQLTVQAVVWLKEPLKRRCDGGEVVGGERRAANERLLPPAARRRTVAPAGRVQYLLVDV